MRLIYWLYTSLLNWQNHRLNFHHQYCVNVPDFVVHVGGHDSIDTTSELDYISKSAPLIFAVVLMGMTMTFDYFYFAVLLVLVFVTC